MLSRMAARLKPHHRCTQHPAKTLSFPFSSPSRIHLLQIRLHKRRRVSHNRPSLGNLLGANALWQDRRDDRLAVLPALFHANASLVLAPMSLLSHKSRLPRPRENGGDYLLAYCTSTAVVFGFTSLTPLYSFLRLYLQTSPPMNEWNHDFWPWYQKSRTP